MATKDNAVPSSNEIMKIFEQIAEDSNTGKYKSDAIALYYAYVKHIWKDNLSLLQVPRAAEYLNVSPDRIRFARKILFELDLIETKTMQYNDGTVRHFILLKKYHK